MLSDPKKTAASGAESVTEDATQVAGTVVADVAAVGGAAEEVAGEEVAAAAVGAAASTSSLAGDDAATDAGVSSLPPSEMGARPTDGLPTDGVGSATTVAGGMVGPPSPLTGCYLLIILGEPHSEEHKDKILQHLLKGFLSWDVSDCHVDLEEELRTVTQHAPEGEEARYGERLIQYASENLVTEVLIHPQYNTLIQCMRNLLSSFTRHRHIIHAGYTFSGNGSWILQDGTFSVADFSEALQEHDVQRVMRAYADTITMNIQCADAGLWHTLPHRPFARSCKIRINSVDVLDTSSESLNSFLEYLSPMLVPSSVRDLLETSDVVGNIRFAHPTLYVFPGGQGDSALFGINGFNMLVDGGFNRKACFWDFARHLDRLDAVLMTRLNNSNIQGLEAVISRKCEEHVYPQIGHFFSNIPDRKGGLPSPDGDKDRDPLLIDLFEHGHNLISDLKSLDIKPQTCYRNAEPINLYHKVGHGTLDMYVISPSRDSKEVKEFLQKWSAGDQRLFSSRDSRDFNFPLQNLVSICALIVWQPANPEDTITRILFPGSTPDYKIQEGLEKLKHLEFMKYSTCTAKSLTPIMHTTTKKTYKSVMTTGSIETAKVGKFSTANLQSNIQEDNKLKDIIRHTEKEDGIEQGLDKNDFIDNEEPAAETGDETTIEQAEEFLDKDFQSADNENICKKQIETSESYAKNADINQQQDDRKIDILMVKPQSQIIKDNEEISEVPKKMHKMKSDKPRAEVKPVIRSRIDTKPPKALDRKTAKKDITIEKKSSPTASPKKQQDQGTKSAALKDIKPKVISRPQKSSPSSTPAKSTKDANNRRVLESKQQLSKHTSRREVTRTVTSTTTEKKERSQQVQQRKPISRRPRAVSPTKRGPGSPVKSLKPKTDLRKIRLDKGETTDSSLVSTPSIDDVLAVKKLEELTASQELYAEKQRELDDLKEEQEVVREIEAVFNRDEKKRQKQIKSGIRQISKQDSNTEAEEEEEYLIIEREEIDQYTEDSIQDEIQKHQRDSEDSEKKRGQHVLLEDDNKTDIKITSSQKSDIKAELQEIITKANEFVTTQDDDKFIKVEEEISPLTPEDKLSSHKKTSDEKEEEEEVAGVQANLQEAMPEEKISGTIESGATTAPTLPEDERIPLDEIKEDIITEDKQKGADIKHETIEKSKEKDLAEEKGISMPDAPEKSAYVGERVLPMKMTFDIQQNLLRDVIKTPDEVADLPVHEEADLNAFDKDMEVQKPDDRKTIDDDSEAKKGQGDKDAQQEGVKVSEVQSSDNMALVQNKDEEVLRKTTSPQELEKKSPKSAVPSDEKEASDMTSDEDVPVPIPTVFSALKTKEKDDTISMESQATIEENIEIGIEKTQFKKSISNENIPSPGHEAVSSPKEVAEMEVKEVTTTSPVDEIIKKADAGVISINFSKDSAGQIQTSSPTIKLGEVSSEIGEEKPQFDISVTELRESHITSVGSPEFKITISERDEPILHDIKEEEEEIRTSPPLDSDTAKIIRPVSPREEEVIKIVTDVADVLKSEKDITEIIPDFITKQLKEKLIEDVCTSPDDSETTKVTRSIILPLDIETVDVDSEISSTDQKSGPESIEEKDKIEESEKMINANLNLKKIQDISGLEDNLRRESAISTFSEKDLTKDESTSDEKSLKTTLDTKLPCDMSVGYAMGIEKSSNLTDDTVASPSKEGSRPESVASHKSIAEDKEEVSRRESTISKDGKPSSPPQDLSRPESMASHVSETEQKEEVSKSASIVSKDDKTTTPPEEESRPESVASHKSIADEKQEKQPSPPKEESRPESVASHVSEAEDKEEVSRRESTISKDGKPSSPPQDISRPESMASHVSETEQKEEVSKSASIVSKDDKTTTPPKEESRPESVASLKTASEETTKEVLISKGDKNATPPEEPLLPKAVHSAIRTTDEKEVISAPESVVVSNAGIQEETVDFSSTELTMSVEQKSEISRKPSIPSKDETVVTPPKESSRPASVISHTKTVLMEEDSYSKKESSLEESSAKSAIRDSSSPPKEASRLDFIVSDKSYGEQHGGAVISDITISKQTPPIDKSESQAQEFEFEEYAELATSENISLQQEMEDACIKTGTSGGAKMAQDNVLHYQQQMQKLEGSTDNIIDTVAEFIATEKVISFKESASVEKLSSERAETQMETVKDESVTSKISDTKIEAEDETSAISVKESRSKSIASIMMTSVYKPTEEVISEEPKNVVPKDAPLSEKLSIKTSSAGIIEKGITFQTTKTDTKFEECEMTGHKTPPTAPVSPGIKSPFVSVSTTTQVASVEPVVSSTTSITGPLSPKDVSGKSSPGMLTSESQSIPTPMGRDSQNETPESSPKPTSPFPRVSKEELKSPDEPITVHETISFAAESESSSEITADLQEGRSIDNAAALSSSTEKIITTTITTVTKVISADGKETVTQERTVTTTDSTEADGEKVRVTTTRTTSESDKSDPILPKEVTILRGMLRSATPASDDERAALAYMSDDAIPSSPRSIASSQGHSYDLQRSNSGASKRSDFEVDDSQDDLPPQYGSEEHSIAQPVSFTQKVIDPMSTSFYGELPASFDTQTSSKPIPIQVSSSAHVTSHIDMSTSSVTKAFASDHKFLEEADLDFEKALKEHMEVRGADVMSSVTAKYSYSPSKRETLDKPESEKKEQKFPLSDVQKIKTFDTTTSSKSVTETKTTTEAAKESTTSSTTSTTTETTSTGTLPKDPFKEWGKPLGLPSPVPVFEGDVRTTPKKERRLVTAKTRLNNEKNLRKRSESPNKAKKASPVYVDLTYVPHNGNSYYSHVEFFKRVRARYYVFSGTEPSRQVYDALLEAKQTWENKELEVTIIPTYDTDVLGYWVAENEELMAKYHIDLSPSASRCTINLQDHETSCSAYRLEF